jgi:RNA polymerase sigma-70 factor (ECF subfamily)
VITVNNAVYSRAGINPSSQPLTERSRTVTEGLKKALLETLPQLRRFAHSLTGNRHDGDDLMQTTVERVLERGGPEDADDLRPWMFKICKNLWIDERRAHAVRARAASSPELADERVVSGEDVALGELTLREVERAMALLPKEQRLVLSLVTIEDLSYREAADILDTPIGTVMSRLARARAALVRHFEGGAPSQEAIDE